MPVMGVRVILFYCHVSAKYLFYISGGWVFVVVGWWDFVGLGFFLFLASKHRLVFSNQL